MIDQKEELLIRYEDIQLLRKNVGQMVHIKGILGLSIHIYSDQECIFVIRAPLYSDQESAPWLIYSHILDQL